MSPPAGLKHVAHRALTMFMASADLAAAHPGGRDLAAAERLTVGRHRAGPASQDGQRLSGARHAQRETPAPRADSSPAGKPVLAADAERTAHLTLACCTSALSQTQVARSSAR